MKEQEQRMRGTIVAVVIRQVGSVGKFYLDGEFGGEIQVILIHDHPVADFKVCCSIYHGLCILFVGEIYQEETCPS
jgi:hypothetical protein